MKTLPHRFAGGALRRRRSRAKTLDVYLIDVEGGKALLMVSPSGESLLIDVGWPASTAREGLHGPAS